MVLLAVRRPPYLTQKLFMQHHTATVCYQNRQQTVLDRGQMDFGASAPNDTRHAVHLDLAKAKYRPMLMTRRLARSAALASQIGTHPGQQLADPKGFGQVVIGTGVERGDFVVLVGARRQHQHRHVGPAAHVADQVHTVAVRQAQVQHDQVRLACAHFGQAALQAVGFKHLPTLGLQRHAHEATDLGFVLDDDGDGAEARHVRRPWEVRAVPGVATGW